MDAGTTVTQIGKYPVLGILGVGGMGVVYRAMDKSVGREVAIKTLTDATEELRQRFLLEARSGILNHPNIVTVYDFGEQEGNPYIVMEFVPGDSLENLLRSGRQFSLIEKLDFIRQLCLGLGYAHQKGVIHRDIKPANIMVQPDLNIKIVDFGVARLEKASGQTQTGMVIGTFHYISPERLLGKQADGRADIWSAGVILYLLLTGRLPFPGDDPATLHRVVREPQEPLSNFISDYPPALDHLINTALAKSPADRYETAEDMATDIENINEGLKREHVTRVLTGMQPLIQQEQWTSVRPLLLDLQRINPKNTEVKKLLRDVQEKLSRQQKTVQLRQLLSDAEEAVLTQRYADALDIYSQALEIDPANPELAEKMENARQLKEKAEKVAMLLEQSREARKRSDFDSANQLIERALQLDGRNTDLRNERARIVQDIEKANRERSLRQLSEAARNQLSSRQYTDAIQSLRSALEIDPTDAETQHLFQQAIDRQEEQRRRKIIDQIVAEISECIASEDPERALVLIQRAQERLPGEAALLKLKADAEAKQQEKAVRSLVEKTTRDVYNILATDPQQALGFVQQALLQAPADPNLIALEAKVAGQTRKIQTEERKNQFLKQAQALLEAKQFDQAIQALENAAIECGDSPDISSLTTYARDTKRKVELSQIAANALREAQPLVAASQFEAAIKILQPAAEATGDPSVDHLLRQAVSGQGEMAGRIETILTRAQALSASNPDEALQFLSSQPAEIQQQPRALELRKSLDANKEQDRIGAEQERTKQQQELVRQQQEQEKERIRQEKEREQERVTVEAIRLAAEALQKQDLRNGLSALQTVRKTYGDSPRVSAAIADFVSQRAKIANRLVTSAIETATQAIQKEERKEAAEILSRVSDAAEFADSALQSDLKRLNKEVAKASSKKPPKPVADPVIIAAASSPAAIQPAKVKAGFPKGLLIGVLVVVLLGVGGAAYWFLRPAPAAPAAALEIAAAPFGEVVSITSDKGSAVPLPAGDHWTPMRLDGLTPGAYSVVVKGSDGNTQTQSCTAAQTPQVCAIPLQPIDDKALDAIVGGSK
jgi:serine/threonine-protein kinase